MRIRRFQYGISSLLLVYTVVAVSLSTYETCSLYVKRSREARRSRELAAIKKLSSLGGGMSVEVTANPPCPVQVFIGRHWKGGDAGLSEIKDLQNVQRVDFRWDPYEIYRYRELTPAEEDIRSPPVTDRGIANLYDVSSIEMLDLETTLVTDAGLSGINRLYKLRVLSLKCTSVSSDGMRHLRGVTNMEVLDLGGTKLDDSGTRYLVQLPRLRNLTLTGTMITDKCYPYLVQMRSLKTLDVSNTRLSQDCLNDLQRKLPNCLVIR